MVGIISGAEQIKTSEFWKGIPQKEVFIFNVNGIPQKEFGISQKEVRFIYVQLIN